MKYPNVSPEVNADMTGQKLTRDERKALRIEELKKFDYIQLSLIRRKNIVVIEYHEEVHAEQLANGMAVTKEQLEKNCARAKLTVECIDSILSEFYSSYGDK